MNQVADLNVFRKAVTLASTAGVKRNDAIRWVRKDPKRGLLNLTNKAERETAYQNREYAIRFFIGDDR